MLRALAVALLATTLAATAAMAVTPTVGLGVFGGASIPIVQEDVTRGTQFGVRVPVHLVSILSVEPYYSTSSLGKGELPLGDFTYTRDGFSHRQFGINAMLGNLTGPGVHMYPYAGIAANKLTRTGTPDIKETGYNFGFGVGISPMPKLSLHVRGELNMVVTGDTSRKFGNANLGVSYNLWPLR